MQLKTQVSISILVMLMFGATPAVLFVAAVLLDVSETSMLLTIICVPALVSFLIRRFLGLSGLVWAAGCIACLVLPSGEYVSIPVDKSGLLIEAFMFLSLVMSLAWTTGWIAGYWRWRKTQY
jgi:hypothetical protein